MTTPEGEFDHEAQLRSLQDELDVMQRQIESVARSHPSTDEILASLPPETAALVRAKIAELRPPPFVVPAPPPGSPLPTGSGGSEATLKEAVGEKRWPAFKRLLDEFNWSLRGARDGVALLGDAITHDDFSRWMPKARKEVDIANARFSMIAEDLDHSRHEYADEVRAELRALDAELSRLAAQGAPQTNPMKITGEYER